MPSNFIHLSPNTKWLMMVREPLQSCRSWAKEPFINKDYFTLVNQIVTILFELDKYVYSSKTQLG